MLLYLSPYLISRVASLPAPTFTQANPRIAYHDPKECASEHLNPCHHFLAYLNAANQLVLLPGTQSSDRLLEVAPELLQRADYLGVVYWESRLYLLTTTGDVYLHTGMKILSEVSYLVSGNGDECLKVRLRDGYWRCYNWGEFEDQEYDSYPPEEIPPQASAATSEANPGLKDPLAYVLDGQVYYKWYEHRRLLVPYRSWIIQTEIGVNPAYVVHQGKLECPDQIQGCIADQIFSTLYYFSGKQLYCAEFDLRTRRLDGTEDDETSLNGIDYLETLTLPADIREIQLFTSLRDRSCHFAALLETGKVYLSQYQGVVETIRSGPASLHTWREDRLFLLMEDNTLQAYQVHPEGLDLLVH